MGLYDELEGERRGEREIFCDACRVWVEGGGWAEVEVE